MGGIKARINAPVRRASNRDAFTEKLFREERDYRSDRLE